MTQQGGPQGPWQQGPGHQPGSPSGPWQQPGAPTPPPGAWQHPPTAPGGWGPSTPPNAWQPPAGPPATTPGYAPPTGGPGYAGPPSGPQPGYPPFPPPALPPAGGPPPGGYPPGPGGDQWNPVAVSPTGGDGPKKSRTPVIVTAVAVVVALLAGAAVWFFAFRDTTSTASGQATPDQAVSALFDTLSDSDPIGLADRLDPAEAALFTDLSGDLIAELQRLEVLSSAASVDSMTGTQITVAGLTYGNTIAINDRVSVVELTGGTVTVQSDPANIPLTDTFKQQFAAELSSAQPQSETLDIADAVASNDGQPIRIATVDRGGDWYVSLFYTIADNVVQQSGVGNPTEADRIDAVGAASAEDAVRQMYAAAIEGRLEDVIALLPPGEMSVLHDYGRLLLRSGEGDDLSNELDDATNDLGFTIEDMQFATSEVTGGTKVMLESATLTANGQTGTITIDRGAGSIRLEADGQDPVLLNENSIDGYLSDITGGDDLDPQLLEIIQREFRQLMDVGVVTVQVDGAWYVSPFRSVGDVFLTILKGLEPADLQYLISLADN